MPRIGGLREGAAAGRSDRSGPSIDRRGGATGALDDAPLELYVARERLEQAKQAMIEKEYVAARRLADDAVANAELGRAKAQGARNQREADEIRAEVETIQNEIERKRR